MELPRDLPQRFAAFRNRPLMTLMLGHLMVDMYVGLLPVFYPLLIDRFAIDLKTVGFVSLAYTGDRKAFGRPINQFQALQFKLADMETELQAARYLLYVAAAKVTDNAPDKTRFAAMAKRLATDTGSSVVDRALQLHGGYGYLQDYPIERFWRDLRVHSILEGTNQIMRVIVSRDLMRQ